MPKNKSNNNPILLIDTADIDALEVCLYAHGKASSKRISAKYRQSEKLIGVVKAVLKSKKVSLHDLGAIAVVNQPAPFTALRIGIATANALGWALGIPVVAIERAAGKTLENRFEKIQKKLSRTPVHNLVAPAYGAAPNITLKKHG